ncbi:MAG: START domain-containing protein [Gammaproteobacteria bacterium]|nr:START domain-containing protein [Gammaproteobacteria bacterium]
MRITLTVITIFLFHLPLTTGAAEAPGTEGDNWNLKRDRDGVQVYTRNVEGSPYDAVRATTVMENIRLSSLVALIMDVEACPNWADRCAASSIHEYISETEQLIYSLNDLPFPVKDRDVLTRTHWSQDPETSAVYLTSNATNGIIEEVKGKLRLTEASVSWHFLPQEDGSIQVVNEAHINPGSALPGWIINMLLVETPFETMKAFRDEVTSPKYANTVFEFVTEPGNLEARGKRQEQDDFLLLTVKNKIQF